MFVQPKAQAQEQPPPVKRNLIGGNIGFGYAKQEPNEAINMERTNTSISFSPVYAYYFKPNVAVGASLGYYYNKTKNFSSLGDVRSVSNYMFRPFIRFEIPLWQSRFSIYNDLGVYGSYVRNRTESDSTNYGWNEWGGGAFYEPGLMFHLKSNIMLQASLGTLLSYSYSASEGSYAHNFGLRSTHSGTNDFMIGINFLF